MYKSRYLHVTSLDAIFEVGPVKLCLKLSEKIEIGNLNECSQKLVS